MQALERGDLVNSRAVSPEDVVFEFMLNALRLRDGFDMGAFERATGQGRAVVETRLDRLMAAGLLEARGANRVAPSERGFDVLNEVFAAFLPASGRGERV
jgi:oxygen-independent coproporphyrinogen-3 oxidase